MSPGITTDISGYVGVSWHHGGYKWIRWCPWHHGGYKWMASRHEGIYGITADIIYKLYPPWCHIYPRAVMPSTYIRRDARDTSVSTYIRRDARRHQHIHLYPSWCQETSTYPLISVVMPGDTLESPYIRRDAKRHPRIPIYPSWYQAIPYYTTISPYIRRYTTYMI